MILAIFLVGAFIYVSACMFEEKQNKRELEEMKRSNKLIRRMLNGNDIKKNDDF